jgi:hypothetical protein
MSYAGKLYLNTGFNTSNIPDSPALLEQCEHYNITYNLEIMQDRFLDHVDVNVINYETIKNTDYCLIGSWYYFVDGITMIATDVARLSLSPDFITSANGITGFTILDGITERVHVAEDTFGKADSNDPLLTPFEPLHVESHWKKPATGGKTYAESTIYIKQTISNKEATVWSDSHATASVLTPHTQGVKHPTIFTYQNGSSECHGTCVYEMCSDSGMTQEQQEINDDIGTLRELGLEQSIINQVRIPNAYVATSGVSLIQIEHMTARTGNWPLSEFPYIGAIGTVKNKLLYYSKYLKYGLISCAGESCEFEPQDLKSPTDEDLYPTIKYITDPHLDGKPYFRFTKVNGDSSNEGFWRNCIAGMPWKQIPLIFTQASGSALNQMKFENTRGIAEGKYGLETEQRALKQQIERGEPIYTYTEDLPGVGGFLMNSADSGRVLTSVMGDILGSKRMGNYWINQNAIDKQQDITNRTAAYDYGSELRNQLLDIAINANVVVPTVNFPYNSHILQEQFENGVLAYKYSYTDNDIARIDKLLTMYGYKFAKPLETSDFTNRQYFNFVECSNVTVTGHARWWNDGIAAQLKGGVRVWHVLPSPSYYNNNPVA